MNLYYPPRARVKKKSRRGGGEGGAGLFVFRRRLADSLSVRAAPPPFAFLEWKKEKEGKRGVANGFFSRPSSFFLRPPPAHTDICMRGAKYAERT